MTLYDPFGRAIHPNESDYSESERGHEKENPKPADSPTRNLTGKPPIGTVSVDPVMSAAEKKREAYEEKRYRLEKRGLWIQGALCIFTALAFGAAAYYATSTTRLAISRLNTVAAPWQQDPARRVFLLPIISAARAWLPTRVRT